MILTRQACLAIEYDGHSPGKRADQRRLRTERDHTGGLPHVCSGRAERTPVQQPGSRGLGMQDLRDTRRRHTDSRPVPTADEPIGLFHWRASRHTLRDSRRSARLLAGRDADFGVRASGRCAAHRRSLRKAHSNPPATGSQRALAQLMQARPRARSCPSHDRSHSSRVRRAHRTAETPSRSARGPRHRR
jgi:hypothetical protein